MTSNENWVSEVERILEHMYPDEWDHTEDDQYHLFIIHYPEITIRNSKEESHIIKDLYIRLRFFKEFNDTGRLYDIQGNRSTFNQAEFESKYSHSHLSSAVVINNTWGGFCMGTEDIVTDIGTLQADGFNDRLFEIVLHQLDIFIQWESLEGVPYKNIANIKRRTSMPTVNSQEVEDAYKRYVGKYNKVNFSIQTSPPKVVIDPYDPQFMAQILPLIPVDKKVLRDSLSGEFFLSGSTRQYPRENLYFTFKGEEIYRTVESDENEEGQQNEWYPHPEYLREIGKRLERKLTLQSFSKRTSDEGETDSCIIAGVMVENI